MAHHAWTRIKKEVNEWGRVTKWIEPGEKVSQSDLGLNDDDWKQLVESGAVREDPYPDISPQVAPRDHFRAHPEDKPENKEGEAKPTGGSESGSEKPPTPAPAPAPPAAPPSSSNK